MNQKEVMELVAKVTDQYSVPLSKMQRAVNSMAKSSKEAHDSSAKSAKDHSEQIKKLNEHFHKMRDTAVELVTPALASVGIAGLSASEAIKSIVENSRQFGDLGRTFEMVRTRSGMSVAEIHKLDGAASQLGISVDAMNSGLSSFGEFLDETQKGMPEALRRWQQMPGALQAIGQQLIKMPRDLAAEMVITKYLPQMTDKAQKRRLLALLGLPEDWASFSQKTIREAFEFQKQLDAAHPFDEEKALAADKAWSQMSATFDALKTDLMVMTSPAIVKGLDKLTGFINDPKTVQGLVAGLEKAAAFVTEVVHGFINLEVILHHNILGKDSLADDLRKHGYVSDDGILAQNAKEHEQQKAEGEKLGQFNPNWSLAQRLQAGMSPISFETTSGGGNKVLTASVKQGFLDAFRELMAGSTLAQGGGGMPGLTNASYEESGGGFGSRGFRSPGLGDHGTAHSMPPQGSNAFNGVGGQDAALPPSSSGGPLGPFDRERFRRELANNPGLRDKIMRIAENEEGSNPAGTQAIIESMMNRAVVRHTSLAHEARWHNRADGMGYYAPGSMGRGLSNPKTRAVIERSLQNALNNSNISNFATDNSSNDVRHHNMLAFRDMQSGKFRLRYKRGPQNSPAGEFFFAPGNAEPRDAREWDKLHTQALAMAHGSGSTLSAMVRGHQRIRAVHEGNANGKIEGHAHVSIDLNGAPRGTRTRAKTSGVFKSYTLTRGRNIPNASMEI